MIEPSYFHVPTEEELLQDDLLRIAIRIGALRAPVKWNDYEELSNRTRVRIQKIFLEEMD